jgi:hypothetical protein
MDNNFTNFTPFKFVCEKCDYKSNKKYDYNRHILTAKHIRITLDNKKTLFDEKIFKCECSKEFKYRSGLSKHKKKCTFNNDNNQIIEYNQDVTSNDNKELKGLVCKLITENNEIKNTIIKEHNELIKENKELRAQVSELIPKVGNNNTTNNIQNNNKLSINVFLNEKCKDAINMKDFIKSIEISLEHLDFTNKKGLADGLSKSIIDNMNKLSVYERPLHCTDIKRETLYIKDDNEWSKDSSKEKIKHAIKKASSKNYNALQEWKTENPDFMENDLKQEYFTKTITTIGKSVENIDTKVIKNLCKETYVKDNLSN